MRYIPCKEQLRGVRVQSTLQQVTTTLTGNLAQGEAATHTRAKAASHVTDDTLANDSYPFS